MRAILKKLHDIFLSENTKERAEKIIIWISIFSFLVHLALIILVNINILDIANPSGLLTNPISAIYTPFSFILLYEVYLLVYHIPKLPTIFSLPSSYLHLFTYFIISKRKKRKAWSNFQTWTAVLKNSLIERDSWPLYWYPP